MVEFDPAEPGGPVVREMAVARVSEPTGADHAEVTFLESARFYRLPKSNHQYSTYVRLLKDAQVAHRRVGIRLGSIDSDVIDSVEADLG